MRRVAAPAALSLGTLAVCLACACFSASSGGQATCELGTNNPASFAWPCDLTLRSQIVQGACYATGGGNASGGGSLEIDGLGDAGTCDVTLVFTNGLRFSQSLQVTLEPLGNGCSGYAWQPAGPFQVAPPCGEDASTSDVDEEPDVLEQGDGGMESSRDE